MKIITWNTELYIEKTLMPICKKYRMAVDVVREYLSEGDAVCFLQEIPYCSSETWEKHTLFLELQKDFPEKEYELIFNITSKKQIMMTVAIAKKGTIKKADCSGFNSNRMVTIRCKDTLQITGIHADNGKDNIRCLQSLNHCDSDIILGDFNAGDYEQSENREIFKQILGGHVCICNEITKWTQRPTPIDHVLVKKDIAPMCSKCNVQKEIKCSDHYPIFFEVRDGKMENI